MAGHIGSTIFDALDSEVQRLFRATSSDVVMMGEEDEKCKVVTTFEEILNVENGLPNKAYHV
ncbi:hypothetical protein C5167_016397 [Papaver somniferum]|nr:hypothetical protein C5167_016397 [Papaver somniferum]